MEDRKLKIEYQREKKRRTIFQHYQIELCGCICGCGKLVNTSVFTQELCIVVAACPDNKVWKQLDLKLQGYIWFAIN